MNGISEFPALRKRCKEQKIAFRCLGKAENAGGKAREAGRKVDTPTRKG